MSKNIYDEQTRGRIARFLPDAIARATTSYHKYAGRQIDNDEFGEHHKNLRTAAAHLELLLKLATIAGLPEEAKGNDRAVLAGVMAEARKDLQSFHEGHE